MGGGAHVLGAPRGRERTGGGPLSGPTTSHPPGPSSHADPPMGLTMNSRWLAMLPEAPVTATWMVFFHVCVREGSSYTRAAGAAGGGVRRQRGACAWARAYLEQVWRSVAGAPHGNGSGESD